MLKSRIKWIDNVKAFACFLVILGHLLQSLIRCNVDNNIIISNFFISLIYSFHMPLFMCISGMLYFKKEKINSLSDYLNLIRTKFINLGIPYTTFYIFYMILNNIFSSSVNSPKGFKEWIGFFNNPIPPYWYLYALFSIFVLIPVIELVFKNKRNQIFIFLLILKIISMFLATKIYLIDSFFSWGIYFYLGNFINIQISKNKKCFFNKIWLLVYILLFAFFYQINLENINGQLISFILSIIGIVIFINIFKNEKKYIILNTFKDYTFEIFLTHTIFAACIRIVMLKIGIDNYLIHLFIGVIASIYIPVVMSKISKKIKYTEYFFYPIKTYKHFFNTRKR